MLLHLLFMNEHLCLHVFECISLRAPILNLLIVFFILLSLSSSGLFCGLRPICLFIIYLFMAAMGLGAARRLSLVVASGVYSLLRCMGFSLWWLLLLWSTGSRVWRLQELWHVGSVPVAHRLSCPHGLWDLLGPGIKPVSLCTVWRIPIHCPRREVVLQSPVGTATNLYLQHNFDDHLPLGGQGDTQWKVHRSWRRTDLGSNLVSDFVLCDLGQITGTLWVLVYLSMK